MNQLGSDLQENSEAPLKEYWLLGELSAEAQRKLKWAGKIRDARSDGNRALEKQLIQEAAKALACHTRTITRMLSAVEIDGLIALTKNLRSDKGEARYISEPWRNLVVELYKRGNKYSRRTNRHQIWLLIQAITTKLESSEAFTEVSAKALFDWTATKLGSVEESHTSVLNKILKAIREEVSAGEMNPPRSHVAIYKILRAYSDAKNKKARHPGQGLVKVIKTTDGDITVDRSNKVLQIDHTPLDVLVVDQNGEEIGSPFLSVAVDSYSGCIAGYYLGFRQPSSLEVALVLRHVILPKQYGAEYELQEKWAVCGVPEYLVTDRAKEFKSQHLRQVANHLGFNLRYRFMPEQGGIVESVFDKLNKELNSRLPGYKGSNVQKRPEDAEKYASLTIEELEKFLVRHFVDHVNQHAYPGVAQTRAQRWEAMMVESPRVPEERDLDLCLLKQNKRPKVQKFGTIQFEGEIYKSECLLDYVTKNVEVRYNPANIIHLLIYTCEENGQPGKFVGTTKARDLKEEQLSLKELKERKRRLRAGVKALDTSSILDERLALNQFTEEKVRETRKQRRHTEHERTGRSSGLSNIVEFKRQEADTKAKASSTEALLSPTNETKPQRKRYQPSGEANIAVADWNQHLQTNW